jgi:hypothetical protein
LLFRLDGNFRQSYYCEAAGSVTRLAIASVMFATGIGIAVFGLFGGLLGSLATLITSRIATNAIISGQETIPRETWRRIAAYRLYFRNGRLYGAGPASALACLDVRWANCCF